MRTVLGILVAMTGLAGAESESWVSGIVPGETGFEGAVTVATATEDESFGVVTVNVPYLDVHGKPKMGQARLVVREEDFESGKPLPALCNVHYEKDVGGMKTWCKRGWACFTPHYGAADKGEYPLELPIGDSYNLAKAIIQWVRRLPFIDRTRLHLTGGSAGGYMTLAMSAECFPVSSAAATAPVFNWTYNLGYFEANRTVSKYPQKDLTKSPLPVLCLVTMLNDWSYGVFGKDLSSDAYYHVSPVSYADRIANPILIDCPTGDMLVPFEQIAPDRAHAYDPAAFPEGYTRDFQACTHPEKARKTLVDVVPAERLFVHVQPLAEGMHEFTLDDVLDPKKQPPAPPTVDLPWSQDKQWSLVILDEGPPMPHVGHHRYKWATSPDSFTAYHQKAVPRPEILNAAKLERLMERYAGKLTAVAPLAGGTPANRLNFQELEERDVVTGLIDYAKLGDVHEKRLQRLYQRCSLQPFGDALTVESLEAILEGVVLRLVKDPFAAIKAILPENWVIESKKDSTHPPLLVPGKGKVIRFFHQDQEYAPWYSGVYVYVMPQDYSGKRNHEVVPRAEEPPAASLVLVAENGKVYLSITAHNDWPSMREDIVNALTLADSESSK